MSQNDLIHIGTKPYHIQLLSREFADKTITKIAKRTHWYTGNRTHTNNIKEDNDLEAYQSHLAEPLTQKRNRDFLASSNGARP